MNQEIIHDFRPNKLRLGWNGLSFDRIDDKTATMKGIGKGIEQGHYLAIQQNEKNYAYIVQEINYDTNPNDLFTAKIKICGMIED